MPIAPIVWANAGTLEMSAIVKYAFRCEESKIEA
jgi:hypothetical protein